MNPAQTPALLYGWSPGPCLNCDVKIVLKPGPGGVKKLGLVRATTVPEPILKKKE